MNRWSSSGTPIQALVPRLSQVILNGSSPSASAQMAIGSPVVALYQIEGDGMLSVPFTSVSKETLDNLMDQFNAPESSNEVIGETKLL